MCVKWWCVAVNIVYSRISIIFWSNQLLYQAFSMCVINSLPYYIILIILHLFLTSISAQLYFYGKSTVLKSVWIWPSLIYFESHFLRQNLIDNNNNNRNISCNNNSGSILSCFIIIQMRRHWLITKPPQNWNLSKRDVLRLIEPI